MKLTLDLIQAEFRGSTPDNTLGSGAVSPERGDTPLPQSELDPDSLRSGLRDFLQELRDAQRERVAHDKNKTSGIIFSIFGGEMFILADFAG